MPLSYKIVLAMLAITAAFPEDVQAGILFRIGPMQVYPIDIAYLAVLLCMATAFLHGRLRAMPVVGKIFLTFIAWITFEILLGYTRFGFRAFGESRYVLFLFGFFVPFAIFYFNDRCENDLKHFIKLIILVAGWAGIIMFFVELLHGGRFFISAYNKTYLEGFQDFRGVRYLSSTQSFNIMMLGMWVLLEQMVKRTWKLKKVLFAAACLAIVLFTKNRTALLAPCGALVIVLLIRGKFRYVLYFSLVIAAGSLCLLYFAPSLVSGIIGAVLSSFLPATDDTGSWRIWVNAAALEQAMLTPWLGQSYGGYFAFPGAHGILIEAPPHNQYILLFLKTGIVGVSLLVLAMISGIGKVFNISRKANSQSDTEFLGLFFLVFLFSQLIYGFAYGFVPTCGLFWGLIVIFIKSFQINKTAIQKIVNNNAEAP